MVRKELKNEKILKIQLGCLRIIPYIYRDDNLASLHPRSVESNSHAGESFADETSVEKKEPFNLTLEQSGCT